ncbi:MULTISPECIES: hypothetical protein [Photobacterium]|uniref:hypothetical protein n=1 Tax=Photobacterium TaxID=657 RepID=UPI001E48F262|nr:MULTISPECIES: hypothetical protein [Photobacterium]MCD9465515.1 hypothetical protein [Photobacterium phosphoreum]MCD9531935.1 hypothetical protein [Photobacterium carnosum]MCD9547050.1 hypothetical protein [Photobacterium carnosum]
MKAVIPASERVFRLYHSHCVSPSLDTLFNLLNAIHSLNDKLGKAKLGSFFDIQEFIALKALRNLFHHKEELINELRIIPAQDLPPITTDLLYLCLVPTNLVEKAILAIPNKYLADEEPVIKSVLGWYGEVVNINPCIFNFMVNVYEFLASKKIKLSGDEFLDFADSYEFEAENGHSHYVTGVISCHAGSVDKVLKKAFVSTI